jgi:hypothetical protein
VHKINKIFVLEKKKKTLKGEVWIGVFGYERVRGTVIVLEKDVIDPLNVTEFSTHL